LRLADQATDRVIKVDIRSDELAAKQLTRRPRPQRLKVDAPRNKRQHSAATAMPAMTSWRFEVDIEASAG